MKKLHFVIIGAHPDDPDGACGGLARLMRLKGHDVTLVSATDGSAGHHEMERKPLAERRLGEAQQAGRTLDCPYIVLPIPDGELTASLENRAIMIKLIRKLNPDVIITHRTCDYHPDHRATGQLVMDASYLIGVPLCCPEVPAMRKTPVILSACDEFTVPRPFRADVCVRIDETIDCRVEAMLCHVSQYFEWLPWCDHWDAVAAAETMEEKRSLLYRQEKNYAAQVASRFAEHLPEGTQYAEAYEWNEYGAPLTEELIQEMTRPV